MTTAIFLNANLFENLCQQCFYLEAVLPLAERLETAYVTLVKQTQGHRDTAASCWMEAN